jgi:hypothetical protein
MWRIEVMIKPLPPEAERALAEADERHKRASKPVPPVEVGRSEGPDPTRFGDWEVNGIASDF